MDIYIYVYVYVCLIVVGGGGLATGVSENVCGASCYHSGWI